MEMTKIYAATAMDETAQLHVWRSKFFDKSAKCEAELKRLSASPADAKLHFKVMAEKLLTTSKNNKLKVAKDEALIRLIEELVPLIELRAELAHSHFINSANQDHGLAMLKNANFFHVHFDRITVLSAEQRKKAYDRLASIAGQLAKL